MHTYIFHHPAPAGLTHGWGKLILYKSVDINKMSNGAGTTRHMRCTNQWDHCPPFNIYTNIIIFRTQSILSTHLRVTHSAHSYVDLLSKENSSYSDEDKVIDNCKVTCQSRYDELMKLVNAKRILQLPTKVYIVVLTSCTVECKMMNYPVVVADVRALGVDRAVSADD